MNILICEKEVFARAKAMVSHMFEFFIYLLYLWFMGTDIQSKVFVLIFAFAIFLPIQLLLCFKVKSFVIRLIPIFLSFAFILFFLILGSIVKENIWLYYCYSAISGFMVFICFIGWPIWAAVDDIKTNRSNNNKYKKYPRSKFQSLWTMQIPI